HAFQFLRILAAAAILLWGVADHLAPRLPGRASLDFLGRHSTAIYVSHLGFLTLIPFETFVPNGFVRDNLVRWTIVVGCGAGLSMLVGRSRIAALRNLVR
ncbi:MAG TPA: hypothetical protein PKY05_17005, partial [Fibrobacteria bacterium]|nr:hypothetical protein [Fibrobacteria bacterium]